MARLGGVTTATLSIVAVVGGLLVLGVPAAGGARTPSPRSPWSSPSTSDAPYPTATDVSATTVPAPTTEPVPTTDSGATTSTTSTTVVVGPPPLPTSLTPEAVAVGPSGVATISGTCPVVDGEPLGPVEVWEVGATISSRATGITAASWSFEWHAPATAGPLVLQVWCGDPWAHAGGYPTALQIEVEFVDQLGPTTSAPTGRVLPATD